MEAKPNEQGNIQDLKKFRNKLFIFILFTFCMLPLIQYLTDIFIS